MKSQTTKENLRKWNRCHSIEPDRLKSLDEIAEYLDSIISSGCEPIEKDGEISLMETRHQVSVKRGMKITINSNEHPPPHFHLKSATIDATFSIKDCSCLNGCESLSSKDKKFIKYWYNGIRQQLIESWNKTRPDDCPVGIYKEK